MMLAKSVANSTGRLSVRSMHARAPWAGKYCSRGARHGASFNGEAAADVQQLMKLESTPLVALEKEASSWGLGGVFVKDEAKRLGVDSFKVVGGTYAVCKIMCEELAIEASSVASMEDLKAQYVSAFGRKTFATATDGNHGRGIAWAAKQLGQEAKVYMPKGTAQARVDHVTQLGGTVEVTEMNYDDTVAYAQAESAANGWTLVQDTTVDDEYIQIPTWIGQGYTVMVAEALEQMGCGATATANGQQGELDMAAAPTHVILQCGVGSMASAVAAYLHNVLPQAPPTVICVEPRNAACLFESAKAQRLMSVDGDLETMMAGLACGVPSTIAWPILRDIGAAFFVLDEAGSGNGMRVLAEAGVESGESGSPCLGLLEALTAPGGESTWGKKCAPRKAATRSMLGLGPASRVLIFNTEGATDPENYALELAKDHVKAEDVDFDCVLNELCVNIGVGVSSGVQTGASLVVKRMERNQSFDERDAQDQQQKKVEPQDESQYSRAASV
eukprot:g630.t1